MNWIQKLTQNENMQNALTTFLDQYGFRGLEKALSYYSSLQLEYVCKTKSAIYKIKMDDIYFIKIQIHTISVYTKHGIYRKYGSLTEEQKHLSSYGFIRCNQSCIVSLGKIRSICNNTITLVNNMELHMSQHYAPKVLIAFSNNNTLKSLQNI